MLRAELVLRRGAMPEIRLSSGLRGAKPEYIYVYSLNC
ncbi:hypothetical protein OHAE_1530 [Ochrobactrum soli]|uniref:Uncharacterized protein n=1 Tax=Ochrobactrum soli TaxID=2448455 RepID=A0A2P9HNS7_9HYPH|nr:hypothetical protein OHAE_1530 [[Ochrobactrum] soli]